MQCLAYSKDEMNRVVGVVNMKNKNKNKTKKCEEMGGGGTKVLKKQKSRGTRYSSCSVGEMMFRSSGLRQGRDQKGFSQQYAA